MHTERSASPENIKYCFCICYFLIGKPAVGERSATRPWSPVVKKRTQEITFFESEPYVIMETSLARCCSPALWMCNLFYWEKVKLRDRERNKGKIGKSKCVIQQWQGKVCSAGNSRSVKGMQGLSDPDAAGVSSQWDTPWRNLLPSPILISNLCVEDGVCEGIQFGSDFSLSNMLCLLIICRMQRSHCCLHQL